jgi:hypothetical protein
LLATKNDNRFRQQFDIFIRWNNRLYFSATKSYFKRCPGAHYIPASLSCQIIIDLVLVVSVESGKLMQKQSATISCHGWF